jgi:DNA polymerase-3 subunit gamma/tau
MAEALIKQHIPLYLKYRPSSINELVGQDAVKQTLLNAIEHNRLSHAFLFVGPRGTGKTSTARILAKSINCINGPTTTPCQICASCVEIAAGTSPAVFEIDAASNNSVEDARALIEKAPLIAVGGRFKIYIIDECHMLSREAFNALLKTLEEPPPNVIFVLATTEEHKVPPTIASRCQKLLFRLINYKTIIEHLNTIAKSEGFEIEPAALEIIARQARGGMRDALSILDQASLLSMPGTPVSASDLLSLIGALPEDVLLTLGSCILQGDGKTIVDSAERLLMEGREPAAVVSELSSHFLNLLRAFYSAGSQEHNIIAGSSKYAEALSQQAKQADPLELTQIIEQLDRLEQLCRRSTQPAMQFEVGLLSICHRNHIPSLQGLADRVSQLEQSAGKGAPVTSAAKPAASFVATKTSTPVTPTKPIAAATPTPATPATSSKMTVPAPAAQETTAHTSPKQTHEESVIPSAPFWSKLLSTLEEQHRPTWSLVSTHAFPIKVSERELIIGVANPQFQKMIEAKADHVRTAATAIIGSSPILHVRISENSFVQTTDSTAASSGSTNSESNTSETIDAGTDAMDSSATARKRGSAPSQDSSSTLKEAYRLFEGPGSRQIG